MSSFRGRFLLLALGLTAMQFVHAQAPDSSSAPATQQAPESTSAQAQPQVSVQARIKARREQRRAASIREVYDHLYEGYVGGGYLRFRPGTNLQRVNEYNWNGGFTRYFSERLGATLDGRGYYGTPFVGLNETGLTKPAISEYAALIGPTYRFYIQPRYSISGRVMAGFADGNFSGDTMDLAARPSVSGKTAPPTPPAPASLPNTISRLVWASALRRSIFSPASGRPSRIASGLRASLVYRFGKQ